MSARGHKNQRYRASGIHAHGELLRLPWRWFVRSTVLARPALIFARASSEQAVRHHGAFDLSHAQLPFEVAGGLGELLGGPAPPAETLTYMRYPT